MSDPQTPPLPSPLKRVVIGTAVVLALTLLVAALWRIAPIQHAFYTDANTIRTPVADAKLREILWQSPTRLPDSINSDVDEYEPKLSADGLTMFLVRGKAGTNADIFVAELDRGVWSQPVPLGVVNSPEDDLGPEPSADGDAVYFYSNRAGGAGGYDIWVAHRGLDGWLPPINLGPAVNSEFNDYGPALAPDGSTLYFSSNRPQPADARQPDGQAWPATLREDHFHRTYDLYAANITPSGAGVAYPLTALNTPHNEGAPAVSSFGDFLYFASDRPGGLGGFDLYRVRRLRGGLGTPESLGLAVNTPANELDPALALGGFRLYFSSDRVTQGDTGSRSPDLPASHRQRDYNVYFTTSREVFRETEFESRPPFDWAALWRVIGPTLPWLVLALLSLLLLLALLRNMQQRRMDLLTKCLLASLLTHVALMLLFSLWQVTTAVAQGVSRGGPIRIALAAPSTGGGIAAQLRGQVTDVGQPEFAAPELTQHNTPVLFEPGPKPNEVAVAETRLSSPQPSQDHTVITDVRAIPFARVEPILRDAPRDQPNVDVSLPHSAQPSRVEESSISPQPAVAVGSESRPAVEFASAPPSIVVAGTMTPSTDVRMLTPAPSPPMEAHDSRTPTLEPRSAPRRGDADGERPLDLVAAVPLQLDAPAGARPTNAEEASAAMPVQTDAIARQGIHTDFAAPGAQSASVSIKPAQTAGGQTIAAASESPLPAREAAPPQPATSALPRPATLASVSANMDVGVPTSVQPGRKGSSEIEPDTASSAAGSAPAIARGEPTLTQSSPPAQAVAVAPLASSARHVAPSNSGIQVSDATSRVALATGATLKAAPQPSLSTSIELNAPAGTPGPSGGAQPRETSLTPPSPTLPSTARAAPHIPPVGGPLASFDTHMPARSALPAVASDTQKSLPQVRDATAHDSAALLVLPQRTPGSAGTTAMTNTNLDLSIPADEAPAISPYVLREPEGRLDFVKRKGGSEATEAAVELALSWLARHQSADGHWHPKRFDDDCGGCGGDTEIKADIALTGLATLAFLGAGHTHESTGAYQSTVRRALDWLRAQQQSDGDLRGEETMYSHGIATIALSEAYSMTKDKDLKPVVENAIRFICSARNKADGAWRYDPGQPADTSVTGWQVMALKSASLAGIPVPREAFETARRWLDKVAGPPHAGVYAYMPGRPFTPSMTAEGMFVQQLLGLTPESRRMQASAEFVLKNLPDWEKDPNTYYWYYASLALYQHGGAAWEKWNRALTRELLKHQEKDGPRAGSWNPEGEWAILGGRVYQTALCALMLEVYYRYLPLYSLEEGAVTDEPIVAIGLIQGTVRDAATKAPLAGTTIRLEVPDRAAIIARSGADGRYELQVPEMPDFFALSASHDGYVPRAVNVEEADLKGTKINVDFALLPESDAVVVLEATPEVHHLGDDRFDGPINSQFQRDSEGAEFEAGFDLSQRQAPPAITRAELRMMVKGVQRRHSLFVNGKRLEQRLDRAPHDGGFGEFRVEFDAALLQPGANNFKLVAAPSSDDIDDFEFVNIQIHLTP